jgi:hypothetical protein
MRNPCCPKRSRVKMVKIGDSEVGIAGFDFIMWTGYDARDKSEDEVKAVMLEEMRKYNYVPKAVEKEYLEAIWQEYKNYKFVCKID